MASLLVWCLLLLGSGAAAPSGPLHFGNGLPRVSEITLLLPPTAAVKHRLIGFNGCFEWRALFCAWPGFWHSRNEAVVQVAQEYNATVGCSTSALVWAVGGGGGERRGTAVVAREAALGTELRVDVFVDAPTSLALSHHSTRLHVGDVADIHALAYDAEGNVFSSLDGVGLKWAMDAVAPGTPPPLRRVLLEATAFRPSAAQLALERAGGGADVAVVAAVAIGRAAITATLDDAALPPSLHASLVLSVAERVEIKPSPAPLRLPPSASVRLWLERPPAATVTAGAVVPPPIDGAHYNWRSSSPRVVTVSPRSGVVVARGYGTADVAAEDDRLGAPADATTIVVTRPVVLALAVSPVVGDTPPWVVESTSGDWSLVAGRSYTVRLVARDATGGAMLLTDESVIVSTFARPPALSAAAAPPPGGVASGGAGRYILTVGSDVTVTSPPLAASATLTFYDPAAVATGEDASRPIARGSPSQIAASVVITVCPPVVVTAPGGPPLVLPFSPDVRGSYALSPTGGCPGGYAYSVTAAAGDDGDNAVVAVSPAGVVLVRGLGTGAITASASRDIHPGHNAATIEVHVTVPVDAVAAVRPMTAGGAWDATAAAAAARPPNSPTPPPDMAVSVAVGDALDLWLILRDARGRRFHNCTIFGGGATTWSGGSPAAAIDPLTQPSIDGAAGGVCAASRVRGLAPGWTRVVGSLVVSGTARAASWAVTVFPPLRAACPTVEADPPPPCGGVGGLLIALASTAEVTLLGGPPGVRLTATVVPADKGGVTATPLAAGVAVSGMSSPPRWAIACSAPGAFTVHFRPLGSPPPAGTALDDDPPGVRCRTVALIVTCAAPARLAILVGPAELIPGAGSDPGALAAAAAAAAPGAAALPPRPVTHGRQLAVAAVALDNTGQPFTHAGSLSVSWSISGPAAVCCTLGQGHGAAGALPHMAMGNIAMGTCLGVITLKASGSPPPPAAGKKHALAALEGVGSAELLPPLALTPGGPPLLAHHPESRVVLHAAGGSGRLEALSSETVGATLTGRVLVLRPLCVTSPTGCVGTVGVRDTATGENVTLEATVSPVASLVATIAPGGDGDADPAAPALPVGATLRVRIDAFDARGRQFPAAQLAHVDLRLSLHDSRLAGALPSTTTAPPPAGEMALTGAAPGAAAFHVTAAGGAPPSASSKAGASPRVASPPVPVVVYSPLVPHPHRVTLAPGADYVLAVGGGPGAGVPLVLTYSSSDPTVASVDATTGRLRALSPGDATVTASGAGARGERLGVATFAVASRAIASARLSAPTQLHTGMEGAVTIGATPAGLDPLAWAGVCGGYRWSVDHPGILALHAPHGGAPLSAPASGGGDDPDDNDSDGPSPAPATAELDVGFAARMRGVAPGSATISVAFVCRTGPGVAAPTARFTATTTIEVFAPGPSPAVAPWLLPPLFASPPMLPPGVNYTVLAVGGHGVVARVTPDGRLATGAMRDVACIRRPPGASTTGTPAAVVACVRIADAVTLGLETTGGAGGAAVDGAPPAFGEGRWHHVDVASGGVASFAIAAFDASGVAFGARSGCGQYGQPVGESMIPDWLAGSADGDPSPPVMTNGANGANGAAKVLVSIETNARDVVEPTVIGGRLAVRALQRGTAVVRVTLAAPGGGAPLVAFAAVHVGSRVRPHRARVAIGGTVQFTLAAPRVSCPAGGDCGASSSSPSSPSPSSPGKTPAGGSWSSDDPGVMTIDASTGKATAVAEGATTVRFVSSSPAGRGGPGDTFAAAEVVRLAAVAITPPGVGGPGGRLSNAPGSPLAHKCGLEWLDTSGRPLRDSAAVRHRVRFGCGVLPGGVAPPPMPGASRVDGVPYCDLELRRPAAAGAAAAAASEVIITATALPPATGASPVEGRVAVPFDPGFELTTPAPTLPLALTSARPRIALAVSGAVSNCVVSWGHHDRLKATLTPSPGGGSATLEIEALDGSGGPFTDRVIVTGGGGASSQRLELPVKYGGGGGAAMPGGQAADHPSRDETPPSDQTRALAFVGLALIGLFYARLLQTMWASGVAKRAADAAARAAARTPLPPARGPAAGVLTGYVTPASAAVGRSGDDSPDDGSVGAFSHGQSSAFKRVSGGVGGGPSGGPTPRSATRVRGLTIAGAT